MRERLKKIPAPIPVLCYTLAVLFWLVTSLWGLGADLAAKAAGGLYQQQLAVEDFTLVNMHQQEDGSYITENGDPQMIWQNPDGRTIRTLRMTAGFDRSPREMCLYYTTEAGEDFGVNKRVFAAQADDGSYLYTLPQGNITALRLDPCSPEEEKMVTMTFQSFVMNEPASLASYFAPGWYGMMQLIVCPGLCASAVSLARQAFVYYQQKKRR